MKVPRRGLDAHFLEGVLFDLLSLVDLGLFRVGGAGFGPQRGVFCALPLLLPLDVERLGLAQVADRFLHPLQFPVPRFLDLLPAAFVFDPPRRQRLKNLNFFKKINFNSIENHQPDPIVLVETWTSVECCNPIGRRSRTFKFEPIFVQNRILPRETCGP